LVRQRGRENGARCPGAGVPISNSTSREPEKFSWRGRRSCGIRYALPILMRDENSGAISTFAKSGKGRRRAASHGAT